MNFKRYDNAFIINEYGILHGYVMPLILLPSFFTQAISLALLPTISNSHSRGEMTYTKKKINQAIFFSLIIGIPATIIFTVWPDIPLKFIYNTEEGILYMRALAPICLLHYIQAPLTSAMQAMGKAKRAMHDTLIGTILKTTVLIIGSYFKIGLWGLVVASCLNIIFVTISHIIIVRKSLLFNHSG
jgi:stage V sporulation protein B